MPFCDLQQRDPNRSASALPPLPGTLCLASLLGVMAAATLAASISCNDADADPIQPIAFPHERHTANDIECGFCHEQFDSHAVAGMPQTATCATCHEAMPQEAPEIQKLMGYVERDEAIPWVRLYQVPQYTYFPHKWHIRAEIACEQCHGDIGTSVSAVRHVEIKMAWCIDCHEQNQAPVDCLTCHK